MKYTLAIIVGLSVVVTATLPCFAAQAVQSGVASSESPPPSVEAVRKVYTEGRDQDVLVMVERALIGTSTMGDLEMKAAELYFWKGSALRRLGRLDEALVALEHSRTLGFAGPELFLERSLANKSLGNAQQAEQDYQEAERRFPDATERRELYLNHWKWDATEQPRFQIWIAPQAGWDSNVIGLNKDTPLQQGNVDFDSYYVGAYLDAKYFLVQNKRQLLWLEYQFMGREYPQENSVSFLDNVFSIGARQPLLDNLDFEIRATWEEAFVRDTGHFRTQKTIGPALLFQPLRDLQVRLWGDWTDGSYYETVPDPQDRDGTIARVGLTFAIDVGAGWMAGPSVSYSKGNAQGDDYDFRGWAVALQVSTPEFSGFKVVALVSYGEDNYDNRNSLLGFTEKRVDHPFGAKVTITFKQIEKWLGYAPTVSVGYVRHDSNITHFDYSRWTPEIEVSLGVLSF